MVIKPESLNRIALADPAVSSGVGEQPMIQGIYLILRIFWPLKCGCEEVQIEPFTGFHGQD
jgi:hypothetical protein